MPSKANIVAPLILAGVVALAGCGGGSKAESGTGPSTSANKAGSAKSASSASTGGTSHPLSTSTGDLCMGGLTAKTPGILEFSCNGSAKIHVTVGSVTKDLTGGVCHYIPGQAWSVGWGPFTIAGQYKGKQPDNFTLNTNQTDPGAHSAGLIMMLGGKIYSTTNATITLMGKGAGAHASGTLDPVSASPKAPISVDVTC
ncbi:MAG: hypothetical protein FWC87_12030 [Acidimicrobiaceae bacterium]|nr:hypothetical protein [Acidimicrobiaceae bacterium]